MQEVDVVICTHAASLCELYMPFDKALIVIASTRYEIGRHDETRWRLWNDNLQRIADKKGNYVAANNLYDKMYIEYFTGIKNVLLLPSLAAYVHAKAYDGNRDGSGSNNTSGIISNPKVGTSS